MVWLTEHKKIIVLLFLAVLALLGGLWVLWPSEGENLSEPEKAALDFYRAVNITGDAKTATKMDLDGSDWTMYVQKSKSYPAMIMISPEQPVTETSAKVYIYEPHSDSGYILNMIKKSDGWKMADLKTERGLYDFVTRIYPEYKDDWKEVKLP